MTKQRTALLLPNQDQLPRQPEPVFASGMQLAEFRQSFSDDIRPELEQLKKARQASEQEAKTRWVR